MTIEVVYHTAEGKQVVSISGVGNAYYDSDSKILSLEDESGDDIADFHDWTYWRKTGD